MSGRRGDTEIAADPGYLTRLLHDGATAASALAAPALARAKAAIGLLPAP